MFKNSPPRRHAGPSKERVSLERTEPLNSRIVPSSFQSKGPGKKSFQKVFINKVCLEHSKAVRDQKVNRGSVAVSPEKDSQFFFLSPESKMKQSG